MIEFIFWFSIFMIFYAYFGYPICLISILIWRKFKEIILYRDNTKSDRFINISKNGENKPNVTFIITAYNEEKRIEEKIRNSLFQNYPKEKLEIIVASDCSNDRTDKIVESYSAEGVRLVRAPERKGKENAQKYAVEASKGDILVFSDVATILKPDGISNIVANFADSTVGCVSSEDKFIDEKGKISGEGAYVKYEMFLRRLETKVYTLVGLSGSFFAARKIVCNDWAIDLQSDFNTLLNAIKMKLRGISDPKSIGYYHNIADENKEFQRKVRTVLRGISVLMRNLYLMDTRKFGLFSFQLISHKICRWMVPFFMIFAFISNAMVATDTKLFFFIFIIQTIFYVASFCYYLLEKKGCDRIKNIGNIWNKNNLIFKILNAVILKLTAVSKIFYYFVIVNFSILVAWYNYMKGNRATFWEPSKR